MLECSRRGGAHCGHPPLGYTTGPSLLRSQEQQVQCPGDGTGLDWGAPGAKRIWGINSSKLQVSPPGEELLHFAGLQQLWTGHLSLSRCSGRKVNTAFLWRDGSGQEINYFLRKNQQKFQKSHPHPLGTAEEEHPIIPPSHCQKPLPGVRKGDKRRKRVEEKRNLRDRSQGDPLELQVGACGGVRDLTDLCSMCGSLQQCPEGFGLIQPRWGCVGITVELQIFLQPGFPLP